MKTKSEKKKLNCKQAAQKQCASKKGIQKQKCLKIKLKNCSKEYRSSFQKPYQQQKQTVLIKTEGGGTSKPSGSVFATPYQAVQPTQPSLPIVATPSNSKKEKSPKKDDILQTKSYTPKKEEINIKQEDIYVKKENIPVKKESIPVKSEKKIGWDDDPSTFGKEENSYSMIKNINFDDTENTPSSVYITRNLTSRRTHPLSTGPLSTDAKNYVSSDNLDTPIVKSTPSSKNGLLQMSHGPSVVNEISNFFKQGSFRPSAIKTNLSQTSPAENLNTPKETLTPSFLKADDSGFNYSAAFTDDSKFSGVNIKA